MVDRKRLAEELRRMKQLIKTDPDVLARFDKDGNGVIDGYEWEEVVQVVTRRLEREEEERAEAALLAEEARAAGVAVEADPIGARSVADDLFERDLHRAFGPHVPRTSDGDIAAEALSRLDEFVLEQAPGVKAIFEGMARREYRICDMQGREVITLHEQSSDMQRSFEFRPMGGARNTAFDGVEHASGERVAIGLQWHLVGFDLRVGGGPGVACEVSMVGNVLGRKFELRGLGESTSTYLVRPMLRPFTMKVIDPFDEEVGVCHRGWVGFGGFLTGANRTHFHVDPHKVSPSVRWGLVASALYLDVARSRRR